MALDSFTSSIALVKVFKDDEWTTGTHYSDSIDTAGFHRMLAVMTTGTVGVDGSVDIHFDESDDAGVSDAWTEVSGSHFEVVTPANDDSAHLGALFLGARKRYLRAHAVLTGHDAFLGVIALMQTEDSRSASSFDFSV